MRLPRGDYELDFVINRGGVENTAWGQAPFGPKLFAGMAIDPQLSQ